MRGSRFSEESDHRGAARARGWREDRGGVQTARHLERDLLRLWTAPPWQEGSGPGLPVIHCKTSIRRHLSTACNLYLTPGRSGENQQVAGRC